MTKKTDPKTKQETAGDKLRTVNRLVKARTEKGGALGVTKTALGEKSKPATGPKKPVAKAKGTAKAPAKKAPAKLEEPKRGRGRPKNEVKAKAEVDRKAKVAADIKAGLRSSTGRGRPRKVENVTKAKAVAKKRVARAAEGKSARGREASPTSRRSLAKTREATRSKVFQKQSSKGPGKAGMKPSEVRENWKSLPKFAPSDTKMEEKGMHKRGGTTVSFGAGGSQKYRRRTFTFKGKGKAEPTTVKVFQSMRHDKDTDRYVPHRSVRDVESSKKLHSETVDHGSQGRTTRASGITFGAKKGQSKSYAYTKGKLHGQVPGSLEHMSKVGRETLASHVTTGTQVGGQYKGLTKQEQRESPVKTLAKAGSYKTPTKPSVNVWNRPNQYNKDSTLHPSKKRPTSPVAYVHHPEKQETPEKSRTKRK